MISSSVTNILHKEVDLLDSDGCISDAVFIKILARFVQLLKAVLLTLDGNDNSES